MLFNINYHYSQATQVAQWVESACSAGETRHKFNSWLKNIPWKRAGQSTPVFLSGESHGQRGMACYSPQGCKELDKTEVIQHTNKHHYSHVYSSWYIPRHIESQKTVLDWKVTGGSAVEYLPASAGDAGDPGLILGWGDPLEEEMATHFSILAREIPGIEKSGRQKCIGSQRVRHDWATDHTGINSPRLY